MAQKKVRKKVEYKNARDMFQQIATYRTKRLIGFSNAILKMLPQPRYEIHQEDAEKLSNVLKENINPLIAKLDEIAEKGRTVEKKTVTKELKIFD